MVLLISFIMIHNTAAIDVVCEFDSYEVNEMPLFNCPDYYGCVLINTTYNMAGAPFEISGDHLTDPYVYKDLDVDAIVFKSPFDFNVVPVQIFQKFMNLKRFYIDTVSFRGDGARFEIIPSKSFTGANNLKEIIIRGNTIKKIEDDTFVECRSLEFLSVTNNDIDFISNNAFNGLKDVISIDLTKNRLQSINRVIFNQVPKLKSLKLSSNSIKSISANTFSLASNLQKLYLDDNGLNAIEKGAFEDLPKIESINLPQNTCTKLIISKVDGIFFPSLESLETCYNNFENSKMTTTPRTTTPRTTTPRTTTTTTASGSSFQLGITKVVVSIFLISLKSFDLF